MCRGESPGQGKRSPVWVTHIVTLGGYLHRSHREQLALPREAYSPSAWWSTMYVNRRGHDVSNPYTGRSQWGSSPTPTLASGDPWVALSTDRSSTKSHPKSPTPLHTPPPSAPAH